MPTATAWEIMRVGSLDEAEDLAAAGWEPWGVSELGAGGYSYFFKRPKAEDYEDEHATTQLRGN